MALVATPAQPSGTESVSRAPLGVLPATFVGVLPCADCTGIRCQLNLLPGGAYLQRTTYLRTGHDDSYYELGKWSVSSDGARLTLSDGRDDAVWAIRGGRTLRQLDRQGRSIDSKVHHELARVPRPDPIEARLRLEGAFRTMSDAPRFRDCRTAVEWPVAMTDDYLALERAYVARHDGLGSELLVALEARLEMRSRLDGHGAAQTLVVEKFLRAMPGKTCKERGE